MVVDGHSGNYTFQAKIVHVVIGSATSLPLGTIIYRQMVCGYHDRILSSTILAKLVIGRACMSLRFSVKWPTDYLFNASTNFVWNSSIKKLL